MAGEQVKAAPSGADQPAACRAEATRSSRSERRFGAQLDCAAGSGHRRLYPDLERCTSIVRLRDLCCSLLCCRNAADLRPTRRRVPALFLVSASCLDTQKGSGSLDHLPTNLESSARTRRMIVGAEEVMRIRSCCRLPRLNPIR